jgi:EAL domain-containing protein (putative c-di-GMP-specific phosphodiesterase class I)
VVAAGCGYLQGYYFSRPLPAGDLLAWWDDRMPGAAVAPGSVPAAP